MATSDFLPLAVGAGANVETQAAYAAETSLLENGFQAGVAPSAKFNKALRQATIMASVLAKWMADNSGNNSVDDGTLTTLIANLTLAVSGSIVDASTTVKGKVELATSAEAQALSDAVRALTPSTLNGALQGANQSLVSSGYQILPGGLIIQWGKTSSVTANGSQGVTFPVGFPANCFTVTTANQRGSSTQTWNETISTPTTTGFTIYNTDGTAEVMSWIAIGN